MIVYNVTTKVTWVIHNNWLLWMQEEHVPEILATGCFTDATILQLLETEDEEGPTYTVQYHAESKALYNKFISDHAKVLVQKAFIKWSNQFISFRSVMQIVK